MPRLEAAVASEGAGERTDNWSRVEGDRVPEAANKLIAMGNSAAEQRVRQRAIEMLRLRAGEIVIDVGAGAGVLTVELAHRVAPGGRVFAVDPSAGLLEQARLYTRDAGIGHLVDLRVCDGRALPFGAAFDAAFCHWVLLHVDHPEQVIAEMRRVTRRGGRVLCVEMDWETAMVSPGDRGVTRRILHHAIDRHVDAWIGRRLPGLFATAGFAEVVAQPLLLTDQGMADRVWLDWLVARADLALEDAVITRDEHSEWTGGLNDAAPAGKFFFAVVQFAVLGRIAS
jgi:ubiquinone/menaquinone biosynthesis C-methylase UbiE